MKKNNAWFFQTNPDDYDIELALKDKDYKIMTWEVNRYRYEIKKNDDVLIWVAGKKAGIYATAVVLNNPVEESFEYPNDNYWKENAKGKKIAKKITWRVLLEIKEYFKEPFLRNDLRKKGLKSPPITKFYQAANFRIYDNERERILALVKSNNQVLL